MEQIDSELDQDYASTAAELAVRDAAQEQKTEMETEDRAA